VIRELNQTEHNERVPKELNQTKRTRKWRYETQRGSKEQNETEQTKARRNFIEGVTKDLNQPERTRTWRNFIEWVTKELNPIKRSRTWMIQLFCHWCSETEQTRMENVKIIKNKYFWNFSWYFLFMIKEVLLIKKKCEIKRIKFEAVHSTLQGIFKCFKFCLI